MIHCFRSFQSFACTTHEAITQKITNSTAVNIYFNNKTKIFTDLLAANGVKTFKKKKGKRVPVKIYSFCFYFRLMLCLVIFSKPKFLARCLIYAHGFGVSQGTNG